MADGPVGIRVLLSVWEHPFQVGTLECTDGYETVQLLHSESTSSHGSLLDTLGLILMFSELNVSHLDDR